MSDQDKSPEHIESEIENTRDELRRDVDALEQKLSPEALREEAHEKAEEVSERVREGTREAGSRLRERIDETAQRMDERRALPTWGLAGTLVLLGAGFLLMRMTGGRRRGADRRSMIDTHGTKYGNPEEDLYVHE